MDSSNELGKNISIVLQQINILAAEVRPSLATLTSPLHMALDICTSEGRQGNYLVTWQGTLGLFPVHLHLPPHIRGSKERNG
jgi:hypothetical protein